MSRTLITFLLALVLVAVFVAATEHHKTGTKSTRVCRRTCINTFMKNFKLSKFNTCLSKCRKQKKEKKSGEKKQKKEKKSGDKKKKGPRRHSLLFRSLMKTMSEVFAQSQTADTKCTTTGLNVRSGACTDKSIVRTLGTGEKVSTTGKSQTACGHTWFEVSSPVHGWVASSYLGSCGGGGGGSGCSPRNYPTFKQCGQSYSNDRLGSSSTICAVGCLMSSVSMAMNALGKSINGQSANPGTLNAFLRNNGGYSGNLFVWGAVSRFGFTYEGQPTDKAAIKKAICDKKVVILNVNGGGHWVLATGYNGDTFNVNDPGYSRSTYSAGEVVRAGIYRV